MLAIDAGIGLGELRPYGGAADGRSCRYQVGILGKSLISHPKSWTITKSSSWFCKVTFIFMRNCKWGMLLFRLFLYCKMVWPQVLSIETFSWGIANEEWINFLYCKNGKWPDFFHWTSIEQLYFSTCKTVKPSPTVPISCRSGHANGRHVVA